MDGWGGVGDGGGEGLRFCMGLPAYIPDLLQPAQVVVAAGRHHHAVTVLFPLVARSPSIHSPHLIQQVKPGVKSIQVEES